jgi:hypothetical protein
MKVVKKWQGRTWRGKEAVGRRQIKELGWARVEKLGAFAG